jgi:hypothetical protein
MNANVLHADTTKRTARTDEQCPLHLVILHDGPLALSEANRLVRGLFSKVNDLDVHSDEFSFGEITHPQLLTESAELATEADLFVFATQDGSTLPIEVVAWLKLWLNRRPQKDTAFVSLIGSADGGTLSTLTSQFLRYLAERHQLTFFSSAFTIPTSPSAELTITTFQQTIRYNPCPEGWGLND